MRSPSGVAGGSGRMANGVLIADKLKALRQVEIAERDQRIADATHGIDVRTLSPGAYQKFLASLGLAHSRVLPRR